MAQTLKSTRFFRDPAFPLACIRIEDHGITAVHGHDFHEIVIILAGRGNHMMDGVEYPMAAGDVFVVRGDMRHGYPHTERVTLVNILYHPRKLALPMGELRDLPGYHALFRIEPRLHPRERFRRGLRLSQRALAETAGMIFRLEQELRRRQPGYRFVATAELMALIGFLSRSYSQTPGATERPLPGMSRALSHIERNMRERFTVAELAQVAHMSESTLTRAFRRVMGCAPIEYVIRARVQRAAEMLRQGDCRVTEAAFACGFDDGNYFSRQFRRHMGLTLFRLAQPRAARLTRYEAFLVVQLGVAHGEAQFHPRRRFETRGIERRGLLRVPAREDRDRVALLGRMHGFGWRIEPLHLDLAFTQRPVQAVVR